MSTKLVAGAALIAAGLSLSLTCWALLARAPSGPGNPAGTLAPASDARVPELRAELEALQRELATLAGELRSTPRIAPGSPSTSEAQPALAQLEQRQSELGARLDALHAEMRALAQAPVERAAERDRMRDLALEETARIATDSASDPAQQLEALGALRGARLADGSDARDAAVVQAMIDLVGRSDDEKVRADVFRQLHGVTDPALREPLLDALARDPSRSVRSEAAETLDRYLDDPSVRAALEDAAANDPDLGVRSQALESLAGGERKG